MYRFVVTVALAACSFVSSAYAQNPAKLCVANMQVSGSTNTNSRGQEQLLQALNKEKQPPAVEKIPQATPEDALAAAKEKGCDYVVTTNLAQMNIENGLTTIGGQAQANTQTTHVTTTYKLTKVSDGSEMASGSFKASAGGTDQNGPVQQTMKKVADKVTDAIRKAGAGSK